MTGSQCFFRTIEAEGVRTFLGNGAGLCARSVFVEGRPVPIVVSDGKRGKPSVLSPRGHYLDYPIHEIGKSSRRWTARRLRVALAPLAALLALTRIDKVVYVNHALLNGSPPLPFDARQLRGLLDLLRGDYPGHALVFSTIVPELSPGLADDLGALGGMAVQSRVVHVLDPGRLLQGRAWASVRHTRRADVALLEDAESRRIEGREVLSGHVERMRELYAQIYLEKHPRDLNPRYETAFFELLLRSPEFAASGWLDDEGNLEAFNIQHASAGMVHWSVCGYDMRAPASRGLFRIVMAHDIQEARRGGHVLNWGAGNGPFKRYRGAEPLFEYDFVFHDHLRADRRLPWMLLHHARALTSGAPRRPAGVRLESVPGSPPVRGRSTPTRPRIALLTSIPALAGCLLEESCSGGRDGSFEVPVAVWLRHSMQPADRLSNLLRSMKRQAAINRTTPAAQWIHYMVFRWLAATTKHPAPSSTIELLRRGRVVVEATSGNAHSVVFALGRCGCDLGLMIGGDVLTRRTLKAIRMPLLNVHLSDPAFVRGLPPVVWEILDRRDAIKLTLHRVTPQIDAGGVVLQREVPIVWGPTLADTIQRTRRAASREIARLVAEGIPRWSQGVPPEPVSHPGPLRTIPPLWDTLRAERICRERFAQVRQRR